VAGRAVWAPPVAWSSPSRARGRALRVDPASDWRHPAFLTDLDDDTVTLDTFHRHHAVVELAIRDLKEGAGLEHVPSGKFFANAAWLACAVLAHNLTRWTARLGDVTPDGEPRPSIGGSRLRVRAPPHFPAVYVA
jgi:hypothetical protein